MRKLFILMFFTILLFGLLPIVSAIPVEDSHNLNMPDTVSVTHKDGIMFTPNINSTLKNVTIANNSDATSVYLWDAGYVQLAYAPVIGGMGGNATFNYPLVAGKTYFVVSNSNGSSYTRTEFVFTTQSYPFNRVNLNITGGLVNDGVNVTATVDNIHSITTDNATNVFSVSVKLLTPPDGNTTNNNITNFSATITPDTFNLVNATLFIWFSNGTLFNSTIGSLSGSSAVNFSRNVTNFVFSSYLWNVLGVQGNGNGTNSSFATSNFSFSFIPFDVSAENYVNLTYETKNETFYINITTDSSVSNIGAFLNYNGTQYAATKSCSGGLCQVQRRIDIPLVTNQITRYENKTWFWQITLFGASFGTFSTNTTTRQQNVTNIAIRNSNAIPTGVNFTINNETNSSFFQNADFKSTMSYYLGEGTIKEYYNFSGTATNFYSFNISDNLTFITTSEIEIKNGTIERDYFFNKELYTNTTTTKKLFIPGVDFSDIIIEVKDQGLIPLQNILINISRFYPDTNTYEQVESQMTDEFGQFSAKLVERDVRYKFAFYSSNNILLKTSDRISIDCRSTICIVPFVIETTDGYFDRFQNKTLFDYSFSFDNTTNIFTYSWDDQTGESATHRLEVTRYTLNSSSIVCNSTSTSTVSTLTCSVGSGRATYKAQVFRMVNGDTERRVNILDVVVGSAVQTYGVEGLLWVFILLFTALAIGAYSPAAGVVLYGVGFIFMGVMGIISMPISVFFANTILCVIFLWAVRT